MTDPITYTVGEGDVIEVFGPSIIRIGRVIPPMVDGKGMVEITPESTEVPGD